MKKQTLARAWQNSPIFGNWTYKNIPNWLQCVHLRKPQKVVIHSTLTVLMYSTSITRTVSNFFISGILYSTVYILTQCKVGWGDFEQNKCYTFYIVPTCCWTPRANSNISCLIVAFSLRAGPQQILTVTKKLGEK